MVAGIFLIVLSIGAIVAGRGYATTARRMRGFTTTTGTVIARGLGQVPMGNREGVFGDGGGYQPHVTYTYVVDGVTHTSDRWAYGMTGLKKSIVEAQLAAMPDTVPVYYAPEDPSEAYLELHTPRLGTVLVAGGTIGVLLGLVLVLG